MSTTENTDTTPPENTPPQEAGQAQLGDAGKAALDAERKARRDAEKNLKTLQDQLKAREDADKTDLQKAQDAATASETAASDWKSRYEGLVVRNQVIEAAAAARAIDPATIYALIRDNITLDDDGQPQGIDKAIKDLAKNKPFLFNTTPAGAQDTHARNAYPLNDYDELTRAVLGAVGAN